MKTDLVVDHTESREAVGAWRAAIKDLSLLSWNPQSHASKDFRVGCVNV